jgi:hypothetical protein
VSLPNEQSAVSYTGNNSNVTAYPVTFPFFEDGDLSVCVIELNGGRTPLALNSDFSVSGGNGETGSIQTTEAIPSTKKVLIERTVPLTQPTAFKYLGKFPSASVDRALDRLTMQVQQVARDVSNSIVNVQAGEFIDAGSSATSTAEFLDAGSSN